MFTARAWIGALVVPATAQVTFWVPDQVTAELGAVTKKGPALETTSTSASSPPMPPPPARLSRAVTRKCSVRSRVGSTSAMLLRLSNKSDNCGKVRDGLVEGANERKR